jgi:hypothetical protein
VSTKPDPKGTILKVKRDLSGYGQLVLDNGITNTITIHCNAEDLDYLANSDLQAIREHLITRKKGHFRAK